MRIRAGLALGASLLALAPAHADDTLQTVVVTAQKRVEDIKEVPLSVSVVSGAELTESHTADYEDLSRSVPGLSFSNVGGAGLDKIEMRGVSSTGGTPTVSMYMNDVPITMPNLLNTGASQPRFFDLDHVEVLRGPQGTLYGSSSMGGAIKFVSHEPELREFSATAYADLSGTRHGSVNFEKSTVLNIPLVDGKLALRVGVDGVHDSGYIDHVPGIKGINGEDSQAARIVLKWQATDDLAILPELVIQRTTIGDTSVFDTRLGALQQRKLVKESGQDTMMIPSLTLRDDLHWADLTSVSSYFWRHFPRTQDGTYYNSVLLAGTLAADPILASTYPNADPTPVGNIPSIAYISPLFRQFSEEARLTSKSMEESGLPYSWIGGVFFSDYTLTLADNEYMNGLSAVLPRIYGTPAKQILSDTLVDAGLTDPVAINTLLSSLDEVYMQRYSENQKQYALFGEFTTKLLDKLKLTIGLRVIHAEDSIQGVGGSYFNADAQPVYSGSTTYDGYAPKFSLSYDLGGGSLYASATKGVRLGGYNEPTPQFECGGDLAAIGLAKAPLNYRADTLWSYELGSKLSLFGNRLSIDSAAYYIDWQKTQQLIYLPTCGFDFAFNIGNARSYGFESEIRAKVTPELTLSATGSATHSTLTSVSSAGIAQVGQNLLGVPGWSATLGFDYTMPLEGDDLAFLRADYQLTGQSHGNFSPGNPDFDRPAYGEFGASLGWIRHAWQWQLYGKNLTNNRKIIQRPDLLSVAYDGYVLRPRTVGLSLSAKF